MDPGASRPEPKRLWRVLLVLLAMVIAFAVGALIAARSDPFAPQVEGDTTQATATGSDAPTGRRWHGSMISRTSQSFREQVCTTDWRSTFELVVDPDGTVRGEARARLVGRPRCHFRSAQPQTKAFTFDVRGVLEGESMRVRLLDAVPKPVNGYDHGGFSITIAQAEPAFDLAVVGTGRAEGAVGLQETVDLNLSRSRNRIRLSCPSCG